LGDRLLRSATVNFGGDRAFAVDLALFGDLDFARVLSGDRDRLFARPLWPDISELRYLGLDMIASSVCGPSFFRKL